MARKPNLKVVEPPRELSGADARDLAVGQAARILFLDEAELIAKSWRDKVAGLEPDSGDLDFTLERMTFWVSIVRRMKEAEHDAERSRTTPSRSIRVRR